MAYEIIDPTLIPNTNMKKYINSSGVFRTYNITPIEGYVLHDREYDIVEYDVDPITGEEIEVSRRLGYRTTTASCGYNYDFSTSMVTDDNGVTHTAYGSRQFFAVPRDSISEDDIFNDVTPPNIM